MGEADSPDAGVKTDRRAKVAAQQASRDAGGSARWAKREERHIPDPGVFRRP